MIIWSAYFLKKCRIKLTCLIYLQMPTYDDDDDDGDDDDDDDVRITPVLMTYYKEA